MYEGQSIGVVVPAHNEQLLISRVIETMPEFVDRILVVDDASTDETAAIVRGLCGDPRHAHRLELISYDTNRGVGGAIVAGYERALELGIDVITVMAGDAQMDPDELESVIDPVVSGEADYVKGNRLFTGEAWEIIPRVRYLGNAALSLLTKIASGYWHMADSQTGYTAISADMLTRIPIRRLFPRYGYPNHILVMLNVQMARVMDVPVSPVYNIGEKSGIRLWKVLPQLSFLLLKWFLWRLKERYVIRDFHPLVFFYLLAFVQFLATIPLGVRVVYRWSLDGFAPPITSLALMLTTILGFQSLLFAMWFDMDYNRELAVSAHRGPGRGGRGAGRIGQDLSRVGLDSGRVGLDPGRTVRDPRASAKAFGEPSRRGEPEARPAAPTRPDVSSPLPPPL